jgi:hypothetical protein
MIYLHVSKETLSNIKSPLDLSESDTSNRNGKEVDHEDR